MALAMLAAACGRDASRQESDQANAGYGPDASSDTQRRAGASRAGERCAKDHPVRRHEPHGGVWASIRDSAYPTLIQRKIDSAGLRLRGGECRRERRDVGGRCCDRLDWLLRSRSTCSCWRRARTTGCAGFRRRLAAREHRDRSLDRREAQAPAGEDRARADGGAAEPGRAVRVRISTRVSASSRRRRG